MPTLERALALAATAHAGQTDKAGAPYVLHLVRVMLAQATPEARIVAVLHDLVEDTAHTFDDLRAEGFSETVLAALDGVTRRAGESYDAFIRRAGAHDLTRAVKLADLEDNMDVTRLDTVGPEDAERLAKYLRAWRYLRAVETGQVPKDASAALRAIRGQWPGDESIDEILEMLD
jgi:(p)ppGpp synthase/HD superfamily hydrolase